MKLTLALCLSLFAATTAHAAPTRLSKMRGWVSAKVERIRLGVNLRRAGTRIGRDIQKSYDEAMQHPDFRKALQGDRAAAHRWTALVHARWAAEDAARGIVRSP
jgi:hypothetical protein